MGLEPVVDDDRERGKEDSMKKMEQYATMCLSGVVCLCVCEVCVWYVFC